jgi:hypothetical protein
VVPVLIHRRPDHVASMTQLAALRARNPISSVVIEKASNS